MIRHPFIENIWDDPSIPFNFIAPDGLNIALANGTKAAGGAGVGGGLTAAQLVALNMESNIGAATITVDESGGGNCTRLHVTGSLALMYEICPFNACIYFNTKLADTDEPTGAKHKLTRLQGLYKYSSGTVDPASSVLSANAALIDDNLTVSATGAAAAGNHEVGVQVGNTVDEINYPRSVSALLVLHTLGTAALNANVTCWYSRDGSTWLAITMYNAGGITGWRGGSYGFANVRASGIPGTLYQFATHVTANYFKVLIPSGVATEQVYEIIALNSVGEFGMSKNAGTNFKYSNAFARSPASYDAHITYYTDDFNFFESFEYYLAPYGISAVTGSAVLSLLTLFNDTRATDFGPSGTWSFITLAATDPGQVSEWKEVPIYNGDPLSRIAKGFAVYCLINKHNVTRYRLDDGVTTERLEDAGRPGSEVRWILNAAETSLGSFGDTSITLFSKHKTDDAPPLASPSPSDFLTCRAVAIEAKGRFNTHIGSTTFHLVADAVNTITNPDPGPGGAPADIIDLQNLLNEIKTDFNNHVLSTTYHSVSDTISEITAPNATGLASAIILGEDVRLQFTEHFFGSMQGWVQVAAAPALDQWALNHTTGEIETGNTIPTLNEATFAYADEGAVACNISQTGSGVIYTSPSALNVTVDIPHGTASSFYVRADLSLFSLDVQRIMKLFVTLKMAEPSGSVLPPIPAGMLDDILYPVEGITQTQGNINTVIEAS